jgi:pimeloyl-ACP methyl ester carboxylesterase
MSDDELIVHHRNWESLCLYAWQPYMYTPQLRRWLGRIAVPTLVLWGASDRFASPLYARIFGDQIPGARVEIVENAGHLIGLEQPEPYAEAVLRWGRG